jgi:bifunctional oligoribonuclease and PAP phosphatase NrnA
LTPRRREDILGRILRAVRRGRTFFLSGHQKPDGDTIGSELAFASFLRRLGKKADIYNTEPVPQNFLFLPGAGRVKTARRIRKKYDVAVIFECYDARRMGDIIDLRTQAKVVVNIDHHAHHSLYGDINLVNPRASSNSEQLYFLFRKAGMPLTRAEASALYVGLVTDTGRFQQDNANAESHAVAAELLKAGAPAADICRRLFGTRSFGALKLMSRAVGSLRLRHGGRVSVMSVGQKDYSDTGATSEDTEDIVNYALMVPSVEAAALLRETEDGRVRASLRGKGRADLMNVAVSFGGGGHKNASGFTAPGSLDAVERTLLKKLKTALPR